MDFLIVAGTKSRDGVMWSQLTVPLTRQAVQIQLVFVNNVLFQKVTNNKFRKRI